MKITVSKRKFAMLFLLALSCKAETGMKVSSNSCDDPNADKLYTEEECKNAGGTIAAIACKGCYERSCMLPRRTKSLNYNSKTSANEPEASIVFEKSLPLTFLDAKYPGNKIVFEKGSRNSNEVTNRNGKKMFYTYDPYGTGRLSLSRCFPRVDGSSTCCDIELPMAVKNGNLYINDREVNDSFAYDGVYRP